MTEREKLKRQIVALDSTIKANTLVLKSKAMNTADRDALQQQMTTRLAYLNLLQQRLGRLSKLAREVTLI